MGSAPSTNRNARRTPLSAADWARAALTVIAERGLAAVAVEPLATRLGTTKGSFYWHFPNRRALIDAALQLWEQDETETVIAKMESEPDPGERLKRLFAFVVDVSRHDRIEVALLASAQDPAVAPVMQRVTERRVAYVASLYEELGMPTDEARRRALLAVSVYLGHVQFGHAAPDSLPHDPDQWQQHVDDIIKMLVP